MWLEVEEPRAVGTSALGSVAWTTGGDLCGCSEDGTFVRVSDRSGDDEPTTSVSAVSLLKDSGTVLALAWPPQSGAGGTSAASDIFAVGTAGGILYFVQSKTLVVEKRVEAHASAVLSACWNNEGTALATAAEDGEAKVWSSAGTVRATLTSDGPCHDLAWCPAGARLAITCAENIAIKPLQRANKHVQWKAHDVAVRAVDWSKHNSLLVTGGEDCRIRVWDEQGRPIFSSGQHNAPITAVSWSPSGRYFAAGGYNMLRLCDRTGWSLDRQFPDVGSVRKIAWAADGNRLAVATSRGALVLASTAGQQVLHEHIEVAVPSTRQISVFDTLNETTEILDVRDRIVTCSIFAQNIIVATTSQLYIYGLSSIHTPSIIDVSGLVLLCVQAPAAFLTVDLHTGVQVYSYEGKILSTPKFPGLRADALHSGNISLNNETVAVIDRIDSKVVRLFDIEKGAVLSESVRHKAEIHSIGLSRCAQRKEQFLYILDKNRELYLTRIKSDRHEAPVKLGSMIACAAWHAATDVLAAIADNTLTVWHVPQVAHVDPQLLTRTVEKVPVPGAGSNASITSFTGNHIVVQGTEGALQHVHVSPFPSMLTEFMAKSSFEEAVRLCRGIKSDLAWACAAASAVELGELDTAEIAFAALAEVEKLYFFIGLKNLPSAKRRAAELALYRRRPDEAEQILIQGGLAYRAIELNLRLFRWERALELAIQFKTHLDTVLYRRQQFLAESQKEEDIESFFAVRDQVEVNEEVISAKIEAEDRAERESAQDQ